MIALMLAAAISSPFNDCNRCDINRRFVVRRQNVIVQAVPQIFYFVGGNLRAEAGYAYQQQQEQYQQQGSDYAEFQQFLKWKQGRGGQAGGEMNSYGTSQPRSNTLLQRLCYECHRGTEPEGDFWIGDSMNPGDVLRSIREIAAGRMPPHRVLSREVKNQLLAELLAQTPAVQPRDHMHEPDPAPADAKTKPTTPLPETEVSP